LSRLTHDALATAPGGGPPPDVTPTEADFTNRLVTRTTHVRAASRVSCATAPGNADALGAALGVERPRRAERGVAAADQRVAAKTLAMFAETRRVARAGWQRPPVEAGMPRLHDALAALVEAGMTPLQALQAATRDAAES
jgi:hypothetical protein